MIASPATWSGVYGPRVVATISTTFTVSPAGVPSAEAPESPVVPPGANAAGLPLSNYDSLTIPSLRARLRVLSAAQVTALLDYERATQARPAVITMFERRLAKLTQEEG